MQTSFWKSKRVLVTGGAGLIGSHLVELLVEDGARVRVVDNLESSSLENLSPCLGDIEFEQADLRNQESCRRAVRGIEVVLNLAARTVGIAYSSAHHSEMLNDCLLLSTYVIEAAREEGVRRFLVVSSSCVYPDGSPIPTSESAAERNSPEKANEGYGWAKRLAEIQAGYYAREYGMEIAIVRLANAYGPRYNWRQAEPHVIPALIRRILANEDPLVIWGSGRQTRSFVHAEDVARGMKLVTERAATGEPVNVGCPEETPMAELASELAAIASYRGKILFDTSRPEGPPRKALNLDRFFALAPDFQPRISLRDGLRQTFDAARAFFSRGAHEGRNAR